MDLKQNIFLTVDIVIFTKKDGDLKVLLIKRKNEPFKGKWAFPGGFVNHEEQLEDAAKRELEEETGVKDIQLEQLYTFGDPKRDPRGRIVSVAYIALVDFENVELKASSDASEAQWFSVKKMPELEFDHDEILKRALQKIN